MGTLIQLLERVEQVDAEYASVFRNDMVDSDGLHESYGSVMLRVKNSS